MSYAGHVLDMIRRLQAAREEQQKRRERIEHTRERYLKDTAGSPRKGMSAEAYEEAYERIQEREQRETRYAWRTGLLILGGAAAVSLLLLAVWRFFAS